MKNVFLPANILIPDGISFEKWSVVACDQFSAEPEYWESVEKIVGDEPSTLNMIVPEAYLGKIDEDESTEKIRAVMDDYISKKYLKEIKDSFIYVERTQSDGETRRGIVGIVDLDEYDFSEDSDAAILASEGTVLDRLPPRIRVRRRAYLELPHIMALINDSEKTVIEPFAAKTKDLPLLYDFKLMEGGGHIRGYRLSGSDAEQVMSAMRALHGKCDPLMVMGDGNHSLAAAKAYWEEIKQGISEAEQVGHPAKYGLVEVNNVYDPAIGFEAIHRVFFHIDADDFIAKFESAMPKGDDYIIHWLTSEKSGTVGISAGCIGDMLTVMQNFLDEYCEQHGCEQEYIHGDEALKKLAVGEKSIGLLLPSMDKSEIFKTVSESGVFPRKSFSIGHARDKRYYLECRSIV